MASVAVHFLLGLKGSPRNIRSQGGDVLGLWAGRMMNAPIFSGVCLRQRMCPKNNDLRILSPAAYQFSI